MEAIPGRPVLATYVAGRRSWWFQKKQAGWCLQVMCRRWRISWCGSLRCHRRLTQMGQQARERVLERHDIDQEAEKLAGHFAKQSP